MSWAQEEFRTLELGDERLNARAVLLAQRLGSKPTESIPNACCGWAETQAAYRFLSNPRTDWQAVLKPHWDCSIERMRGHAVVLNIQDTTELDFNGRTSSGLGPLSYEAQRGMYLHPTYAITPEREPLGVMDAWMWAREPRDGEGRRGGLQESLRWLEGYERVAERAQELPEVRHVYVADREADILALLVKARAWGHAADYLVRCRHDRALPEGGGLWSRLCQAPVLGQVSPAEFSPVAESSGQIREISRFVVTSLLQHITAWQAAGLRVPRIAFNASARNLHESDFGASLITQLQDQQVNSSLIQVEITEGTLLENNTVVINNLQVLHGTGIGISIDDFGTGYSSLAYLKRLPLNELKIDKSFVDGLGTDRGDEAITVAILGLAKALGLHSVAEGVETEGQLAWLRAHGCEIVQGYLFSKPVDPAIFEDLLAKEATKC